MPSALLPSRSISLRSVVVSLLALTVISCGGSGSGDDVTPSDDGAVHDDSSVGADSTLSGDGDVDSNVAPDSPITDSTTPSDTTGVDVITPPSPKTTCTHPFEAADVTGAHVVGTGTAASCTDVELKKQIALGGAITFNCGGATTIAITAEIVLPTDKSVTIDGGNQITLDGGGKNRIFNFDHGDFRKNKVVVTLQHLTLGRGKATGTKTFAPAPAPCSQGFKDGGGGAIYVRDGVLHVFDCTFVDNHGASPGPDVAGGAIYGVGSLDVTIIASKFAGNSCSNGGAVGSLFSNLTIIDDVFSSNEATGNGANYIKDTCPDVDGQKEAGSGGNGGAVVIDGGEDFAITMCGDLFKANKGGVGALGGAVFRTPDLARQQTNIDQCTFDGNTGDHAGAMYFHHSDLTITNTTIANNSALGSGGIQADDTVLNMTNVTLTENSATKGLGGAIALFGNGGTFVNCTFEKNHADGGSGLFGAAIAGGTSFTISNTIFDGNTSKDGGAPMACADGSSTGGNDLQWPDKHLVGGGADSPCVAGVKFADPTLGSLADNGGPTMTIAPKTGSPAIGLGKSCPKTDQRGHARKADGCTAGAFEVD